MLHGLDVSNGDNPGAYAAWSPVVPTATSPADAMSLFIVDLSFVVEPACKNNEVVFCTERLRLVSTYSFVSHSLSTASVIGLFFCLSVQILLKILPGLCLLLLG